MAAPDYFSDTSQFDLARKRAAADSATNLQARKDALQRRFANLGNLDAGARIKIEQQAANDEAQNLEKANEGINAAQTSELGRRAEIKQGQEFASGEAQKGRDFSLAQQLASQKYGTSERLASQGFASGERAANEKFSSGQNSLNRDLAYKQMAQAQDQFAKTFGEEQFINRKNLEFAEWMKNQKDPLEKLVSNFSGSKGILGANSWWASPVVDKYLPGVESTVSRWF